MNVWIKRSLSTAAVAGGLFFAGAAVAQASTGTGQADSTTGSSFAAPLEIGSVTLGVQTESSSKHSSTVTHTDRKGTSTTTKTSAKSSKSSLGLSTGKIKVDPSGTLKSVTKSSVSSSGHKTKASTTNHSTGSIEAPVSIGGLKLTGQHEESSATSEKTVRTDRNGTSTSERTDVRGSKTGGSLGVGELKLNPNRSFDSQTSLTGAFDKDGAGKVKADSTTQAKGSAPISFGGLELRATREDGSAAYRRETFSDRRGGWTKESSEVRGSRTDAGLSVGRFTADPQAAFAERRHSVVSTDGDGRFSGKNSSDTTGWVAAPFRFDGISGFVSRSDASKSVRGTEVTDKHGTVRRVVTNESASHQAIAGKSGAITGNPSLGLTDHRDSLFAADRNRTTFHSDRNTAAHYAFPYSYEGFAVLGDFGNASAKSVTEQVSDKHGTTTRTETDQHADRTRPAYGFDGFTGAPKGQFELDKLTSLKNLDS